MKKNTKKIVSKNTWTAKGIRFFTAFCSISPDRSGSCKRCGECCRLPVTCPFLAFDSDGLAICKIYGFRSLNCRKYPRVKDEHLTKSSCGFSFKSVTQTTDKSQ
jgi:uncharacterized protein